MVVTWYNTANVTPELQPYNHINYGLTVSSVALIVSSLALQSLRLVVFKLGYISLDTLRSDK